MGRPALEVADIFRAHGPAWRQAQHAHLSLGQLKVMSAIEYDVVDADVGYKGNEGFLISCVAAVLCDGLSQQRRVVWIRVRGAVGDESATRSAFPAESN